MLFNDKATFYRSSNVVVDQWVQGTAYTINLLSSPAYLSVEVDITAVGLLVIDGLNASGVTVNESLTFTESGVQLTQSEFKSILTLTPTWSTYKITIKAEDKQGQPVQSVTTFGPFLISVSNIASDRLRDNANISGWERGQWLQAYIESFEPSLDDQVTTSRGWSGWCQDIVPMATVNYAKGWQFYIDVNKSRK